jgi:glycosyltransferase involved in cell wall biosynthesis
LITRIFLGENLGMAKVAAIIPAYNEEKTIGQVVKVLKESSLIDEIVVVSDSSLDKTAQRAQEAGAHFVYELAKRGGKGKAMIYGVAKTDAPILFFLDADLVGLNQEHLKAILEPVLEGKVVMNVGLRDKGKFFRKIIKYLPLIGGERAMIRQVFENIPDRYLKGFKVETALNYYCRVNHLPYGQVFLPGLTIVRKIKKFGFWQGLWEYFKMGFQILWAMIEVRLGRRFFKKS